MAYENLTTYTEVDPNSRITISATRSNFVGLQRDEDAYVYSDKGVNYFSGDFEHLIDIYLDSTSDGSTIVYWALENVVDDWAGMQAGGGDALDIMFWTGAASEMRLYLHETVAGTTYADYYQIALDTLYYLTIKRD